MRLFVLTLLASSLACAMAADSKPIDVGPIDQNKPPSAKELVVPKTDEGIDTVEPYASITGKVNERGDANVYVLVNPLSNPDTRNMWWVQREVRREGAQFSCVSQFGEGPQGAGEHFAVVAMATGKEYTVGDRIVGLPAPAQYTKLKIVKRAE